MDAVGRSETSVTSVTGVTEGAAFIQLPGSIEIDCQTWSRKNPVLQMYFLDPKRGQGHLANGRISSFVSCLDT